MKIIDLQADIVEITTFLKEGRYIPQAAFGLVVNEKENALIKRKYDEDIRVLEKLDTINNALHEAYATTYIEAMGCRLSLATGRQYLRELNARNDFLEDDEIFDSDDAFNYAKVASENMRMRMLCECYDGACTLAFREDPHFVSDPLDLQGRVHELADQKRKWYFDLKKAVITAEVTTEVICNY